MKCADSLYLSSCFVTLTLFLSNQYKNMSISDSLGTVGVSILLVGFFLNLFKKIQVESVGYILLNAVGAAFCGVSAYLISFYPFVVLEGVWVLVSLYALFKNVPRGTK
jgi:hypothetical protein